MQTRLGGDTNSESAARLTVTKKKKREAAWATLKEPAFLRRVFSYS